MRKAITTHQPGNKWLLPFVAACWFIIIDVSAAVLPEMAAIPPQEPFLRIETGQHAGPVRRIDSTADGSLIATIGDDKTVRLWHMPGGAPAGVLRVPIAEGEEGKLFALAMSPDGTVLAVTGSTGLTWDENPFIYVFDVKAAKIKGRLRQVSTINSLAFSPDGRYLAAVLSDKNGLRVFDTENNYHLAFSDTSYAGHGTWVAFAADGRLATTAFDGQVRLYNADFTNMTKRSTPGGKRPYSLAFSPDGDLLAVGQSDKLAVDVLSGTTLKPQYRADISGITAGNLAAVAWTGQGADLALWAGGSAFLSDKRIFLRRWSDAGKGQWQDIPVSSNYVNALTMIPNGGLAFANSDPGWGLMAIDGQKLLFNHSIQIADFRDVFKGRFAASADGTEVEFGVTYGGKKPFRFDAKRRKLQVDPPIDANLTAPLLTTGKSKRGHKVTNWEESSNPKFDKRKLKLSPEDISHSAAMNNAGSMLVIGGEDQIYLFKKGSKPAAERTVPAPVWGVTITQDGSTAIAALGDGTIRWYSLLPKHELELQASLFLLPEKEVWIAWTPEGFFTHSENGGQELAGFHLNMKPGSIPIFANFSQVYTALHRPDMVTAKLTKTDSQNLTTESSAAISFVDGLRQRPLPKTKWISFCPAPVDAQLVSRAFKRVSSTQMPVAETECQTIDVATRAFARVKATDKLLKANSVATKAAATSAITTQMSKVLVRFEIQDAGGGIGDIDLFQNGRIVDRISEAETESAITPESANTASDNAEAKPSTAVLERVFALQPGENNLEIRAFNKHRAATRSALLTLYSEKPQVDIATAPENRKRLFIISVGINNYPTQPLAYAVADAKETTHALKASSNKLFDEVILIERYDNEANSEGLKSLFEDLSKQASNGDIVLFYFAAHGSLDENNQYYLITQDSVTAAGTMQDDRTLTQSVLAQAMGKIQAAGANVMLILDTCHAGAMRNASVDKISGQIQNNTGMMVLAGSAGYQEAYDNFKDSGHGLLAYTALRGLKGDLKRPNNDDIPAETFVRWVANSATMDAFNSGMDKVVDFHKSSETSFQDFPLISLQPAANATNPSNTPTAGGRDF